ncbi:ATP-dependent DNA helicase RecG [Akkermansia sp. N21116]|uniref:ATP-dependent DNA helicase RecG n=1 Tax=Akkermansia sp. N21116 TaxID=3040764 RepID=UPI00244EC6AA|nr:ATP-dependent DNA helicase RecG [Akkermansia sp. N21116]WPX40581.1 ATP-dependent DNA helicase RecG [Akkermansia sp. N21116]
MPEPDMLNGGWKLLSRLDELAFLRGMARERKALDALGISTVHDLLFRLPRRYEDRRRFDGFDSLGEHRAVCLRVKVVDTKWKGFRGKGGYFEAVVEDLNSLGGSVISCRWFHFPGIAKMVCAGQELVMYGKPKQYGKQLCMVHPEFEEVQSGSSIHMDRLVPVYGNLSGLNTRRFREIIWKVFQGMVPGAEDGIYEFSEKEPRKKSLLDLHFPESMEDVLRARRRFALEECLIQQLKVGCRRRRNLVVPGKITATGTQLMRDLMEALPFEMTLSQKRCLREIYGDMKSSRRMNRLLQGDVGSGKTLVALGAMLMAVESGHSAVLMAPTQILAEQHYRKFRTLLDPLGVSTSLRTSDRREDSHVAFDGEPSIVVGTHALLYARNSPGSPGLVVIDEQHKFGVLQRERLVESAGNPDVLVMTATPIPRTLTLTVYGDLDVSVIDELPAGRGKIVTALRTPKQMKKIVEFVRSQIDEGRQVYIVSPLIEESSVRKSTSALKELEVWKKRLPHVDIGLLHGRMASEEKDVIMRDFLENKISVLVSTTVVEVGVDVPNATVMIINDAESFGLSQLHQLRGRIGRGGHHSYCILISDVAEDDEQWEKLHILETTLNGFELAEEDLRLRGPGDVLGTEQSGLSSIMFTEWLTDPRLIRRGKELADMILEEDPDLTSAKYKALRQYCLNI